MQSEQDESTGVRVTADMTIAQVVSAYPQTMRVFFSNMMHCAGCYLVNFHDIATSAEEHGVSLDKLLAELNEAAAEVSGCL